MSKKWTECPECHYAFYKYYEETDIQEVVIDETHNYESEPLVATEVPVVVKIPRGYLCILCRHEWDEDGVPIEEEVIAKSIASFRKYGKKNHAKIHGLKGSTNNG